MSARAASTPIDPPGSRLPLNLASITRAPTLQHISERINLISAQHNLSAPSREVASLLMLAFEVCPSVTIPCRMLTMFTGETETAHHPSSIPDFRFTCYHLYPAHRNAFTQLRAPCIRLRQLVHSLARGSAEQVSCSYAIGCRRERAL